MPNFEKVEKLVITGSIIILIVWFSLLALGMYAIFKNFM